MEFNSEEGVVIINHTDEHHVYVSVILRDEEGNPYYSVVGLDKNRFQPY